MGRLVASVALAGWAAAGPVQATCWTPDEAAAATVRQLQSMLMVTALRCEAAGYPVTPEYNRFVNANRGAIARGNELLKLGYIRMQGPVEGQRAYDSFTTAMANSYGDGAGAPGRCNDFVALAREATAMQGSVGGLLSVAQHYGVVSRLPSDACRPDGALPAQMYRPAPPPPAIVAVNEQVMPRREDVARPEAVAFEPVVGPPYRPYRMRGYRALRRAFYGRGYIPAPAYGYGPGYAPGNYRPIAYYPR